MQVVDCLCDLSENSTGSQLSHFAVGQLSNVFAKTDPANVVSNKEYLFGAVDQIMKVNHTGVL